MKVDEVNFKRAPYRGLVSKMAKQRGVKPSAITNALRRGTDADLMYQMAKEIKRVKARIARAEGEVRDAIAA